DEGNGGDIGDAIGLSDQPAGSARRLLYLAEARCRICAPLGARVPATPCSGCSSSVPRVAERRGMILVAFLSLAAFDMPQRPRQRSRPKVPAKGPGQGSQPRVPRVPQETERENAPSGGPMGVTRRQAMVGVGGGLAILAAPA